MPGLGRHRSADQVLTLGPSARCQFARNHAERAAGGRVWDDVWKKDWRWVPFGVIGRELKQKRHGVGRVDDRNRQEADSSPSRAARGQGNRFRPGGSRSASPRSGLPSSGRASPGGRRAPRRCVRRFFPASHPSLNPPRRRSCSPPPASTISTRRFCRRWRAAPGSFPTGSPIRPGPIRARRGTCRHEFIASLERLTVGANRPDLTLVLDLDPEVGLKRAAERRQKGPADRFESEGLAFHQTLRRAFLDIAAAEPGRCALIDARRKRRRRRRRDLGGGRGAARSDGRAQGQARMKKRETDDLPEADALAGAPHPRHVYFAHWP